jgi:hypothetical protein
MSLVCMGERVAKVRQNVGAFGNDIVLMVGTWARMSLRSNGIEDGLCLVFARWEVADSFLHR